MKPITDPETGLRTYIGGPPHFATLSWLTRLLDWWHHQKEVR